MDGLMFNILSPYLLWIKLAVVAAIISLGIYEYNSFISKQQKIGYDKATKEYIILVEKEKKKALLLEKDWKHKLEIAVEERINVESQIKDAANRASDSERKLQYATKIFNQRIREVTSETCYNATTTITNILGECVTRYRDLAEKADRHVADERLCYSAWPE